MIASTLIPIYWAIMAAWAFLISIFVLAMTMNANRRREDFDAEQIARLTDECNALRANRDHARATIDRISKKHAEFVKSKEGK